MQYVQSLVEDRPWRTVERVLARDAVGSLAIYFQPLTRRTRRALAQARLEFIQSPRSFVATEQPGRLKNND